MLRGGCFYRFALVYPLSHVATDMRRLTFEWQVVFVESASTLLARRWLGSLKGGLLIGFPLKQLRKGHPHRTISIRSC